MIYEFKGMCPKIDPSTFVSESATIIGNVIIGKNCFIGPGAVIRGEFKDYPITIGDESVVEDGVIIHTGLIPCEIGSNVTIGHGAVVHCAKLGNNANIGMGAVLSLESIIGEYSIVAEGAIVKSRQVIPPYVVVGGAPAEFLRKVEKRDIEFWEKSNAWYVTLAAEYKDPTILKRLD